MMHRQIVEASQRRPDCATELANYLTAHQFTLDQNFGFHTRQDYQERTEVLKQILLDKLGAEGRRIKPHRWEIVIEADDLRGAMDAAWSMWEGWRDGSEPKSGGAGWYGYNVKKTRCPKTQ